MQTCTSPQTHNQHPTTQFFTGQMPFLPPNQQHQSTEGMYLFINIITAFVNAEFISVWQFLDACKMKVLTVPSSTLQSHTSSVKSLHSQRCFFQSGIRFKEMHHVQYSSNLAPSNYHLFPNLEETPL